MSKIVLNDHAPADLNGVTLANEEIDSFPYETTDATVLANAESHPWLAVEADEAEAQPEVDEPEDIPSVAIESGLDQNEAQYLGEVAVTTAAADEQPDEPAVVEDPAPQDTFNFGENS